MNAAKKDAKNLPVCERYMNLDLENLGQCPQVVRRALRLPLAQHSSDLDGGYNCPYSVLVGCVVFGIVIMCLVAVVMQCVSLETTE